MRFYLIIAAAATFMANAVAAAPVFTSFVDQDGIHYQFAPSRNSDGSIDINGTVRETGQAFALRVDKGGHVFGSVGASPVSFTVSKATMAELNAETPTMVASN